MNNSKLLSMLILLGLLPALLSNTALADDYSAKVSVTVTISVAPCEINNNQNIDIDFGNNIITTDVMAGLIEKQVNYTLDCSSADAAKSLKMHISGAGAGFDDDFLQTSIPELAVKLKVGGTTYPLNTDLAMASSTDKPQLIAVLVGKPGSHLPTGSFTAGATMTVDYQ